ncbi:hypothetical protein M0R45_010274 [Rubus argutus]|uniref:Uncharacterized protein n=1 Tax=Rubus argutus TaxID=59490 RepID=A0AAW1Y6W5_RUBAR
MRVLDYKTPEGQLSRAHLILLPGLSSLCTFVLKKLTFSKKELVPLIIKAKGENLDCLVKLVKEGKFKTVIDSSFPLSKAEDAWAKRLDGNNTGKIIVEH